MGAPADGRADTGVTEQLFTTEALRAAKAAESQTDPGGTSDELPGASRAPVDKIGTPSVLWLGKRERPLI